MFRFLLSRRWVLFALFVAVLGVACWRLGVWQFDRLEERRAENAVIERNLDAPPAPAQTVMSAGRPLPEQALWRRVHVTGNYDLSDETLVRYQTRDGQPGVTVLTPLRSGGGATVLVDRGWLPVTNDPTEPVDVPAPPEGSVTVTGWAVPDQSGEADQVTPIDGEVRLVSSRGFTEVTADPLLQGYVVARSEVPATARTGESGTVGATDAADLLVRAEPPELNSGPHFFYGLQWWFFAALAVGGFGYFAYAESRDRRRAR